MIIGNNFIFIHVPRTGGTIAEELFFERYNLPLIGYEHNTIRELEDVGFGYDLDVEYNKFIFGFVRNPYAQEWSCWKLHCLDSDWPPLTFDEWIKLKFDNGIEEIKEKYVVGTKKRKEYVTTCLEYALEFSGNGQYDFFLDSNGMCRASKIYRFENLEESWKDISNVIGLDITFDVIPDSYEYLKHYNDYTYQKITENRKTDLETFGYDWGP
jgi:hypothetical protein